MVGPSSTLANVVTAISALPYGTVKVYAPDSATTTPASTTTTFCSAANQLIFVEFVNARESVPTLSITCSGSCTNLPTVSTDTSDGALPSIFPIYGTFKLGFKGENTTDIDFDAIDSDVKSKLEALYSIGQVTVTKDGYGIPLTANGTHLAYYYANSASSNAALSIFNIWSITFSGGPGTLSSYTCRPLTVGSPPTVDCPTSLGREPLLIPYTDNIQFYPSPVDNQEKPQVYCKESLKGYAGNNRLNYDDLKKMAVTLTHQSLSGPQPVIGMYVAQSILCVGSSTGTFSFQFLNDTVDVPASTTAASLVSLLNVQLDDIYEVAIHTSSPTSGSTAICSTGSGTTTIISFSKKTKLTNLRTNIQFSQIQFFFSVIDSN
jgi:hypothetical protein